MLEAKVKRARCDFRAAGVVAAAAEDQRARADLGQAVHHGGRKIAGKDRIGVVLAYAERERIVARQGRGAGPGQPAQGSTAKAFEVHRARPAGVQRAVLQAVGAGDRQCPAVDDRGTAVRIGRCERQGPVAGLGQAAGVGAVGGKR